MAEATVTLTAEQIEQYHREGYLLIEDITTPEELAWLSEVYDRIFRERIGWDDGAQFDLGGAEEGDEPVLPQMLGASKYIPELKETVYRANVEAISRRLMGDAVTDAVGEHMILKPAGHGAATPWHQDQAYHNPAMHHVKANFWMPLDGATVEEGCLWFVPGSHKMDVLPHHSIGHDPRIHGLEVDEPEKWHAKGVPCPVPPGGASVHAAYMLHYAEPNRTNRPRRAYTLTKSTPGTKREVPVDDYWNRNKQTKRLERAAAAQAQAGQA